jgi:hypothetical protein
MLISPENWKFLPSLKHLGTLKSMCEYKQKTGFQTLLNLYAVAKNEISDFYNVDDFYDTVTGIATASRHIFLAEEMQKIHPETKL